MLFWIKIFISSCVIVVASHLAGKKPMLAGFIVALPLTSILSLSLAYWEHRDMQKLNEFALSILVAVPLSLTFFIPFITNRWLKLNFFASFLFGFFCLGLSYGISFFVTKR